MNIEAAVRLRHRIDKAVDVAIQDVLAEAGSAELVDLIDIIGKHHPFGGDDF